MFIGTSFSLRSNCVNVPKLTDARKDKERSSLCRSNCINVPKLSDARKGNKERSFRSAQTASMYLSSLTFAKVHRKSHLIW